MKVSEKLVPAVARAESLEQVKQRFAQWRADRRRGQHIPRALWEAVLALAEKHGAEHTAHELRINYGRLRQRLDNGGALAACPGAAAPSFVEWVAPGALGGGQCVIEMHNARGAKVRIELKGGDLPGCVAGVSRSFWSAP